jgi:YVTN family beta-propeller protein
LAAVILGWALTPRVGEAQSAAQRLQEAIDVAETRGDCVSAGKAFEEIAKVADRGVAARALLYAGQCYERLGRVEAAEVYQRLLDRFPEQRRYSDEARGRLSRLTGRVPNGGGLPVPLVARAIDVPMQPYCVAIASGGREAYVTHDREQAVTVIDTATNTVSGSIAVGAHCGAMRVSADGARVYLNCYPETGLRIIDTATRSVRTVEVGGPARGIAISPDGKSVYVAAGEAGLRKLDVATGAVSIIPGKGYALDVAVTPDGRRLWVSYQGGEPGGRPGHDPIAVFDTETGKLLHLILGLPYVSGPVAITPDGSRVWTHAWDACTRPTYDHLGCPHGATTLIHVIDAATAKPLEPLQTSGAGANINFLFGGKLASLSTGEKLLFLETRTKAVVAAAALPTTGCLAVAPDGLHAYVPNRPQKQVAILELFLRADVHVESPGGVLNTRSDGTIRLEVQGDPQFDLSLVDLRSLRFAGAAPARDSQGSPMASIGKANSDDPTPQILFSVRGRDLKLKPGDREALFEAQTKSGFPIRGVVAVKIAP